MNTHVAPTFAGSLPTAAPVVSAPQAPRGELAVYACGGTGINIVRVLEALRSTSQETVADIKPFYLDTSVSNLTTSDGLVIPASACVKYDAAPNISGVSQEVDGSGGIRAANYELIRDTTPQKVASILPKYAAAVVSSASGGTGSLIAPFLVKELFKTTDLVYVFLVGDRSTDTRTTNTINTIKSMEGIARACGKTVVISYHENTPATPRTKVNDDILRSLTLLSILSSRRNGELDTMDLRNFVQVHNILKDEPHIARLYVTTGEVNQESIPATVTTVATLTADADHSGLNATVRHACMGILPPDTDENFLAMKHIHFMVDPAGMDAVLADLNAAQIARSQVNVTPVRRVDLLANSNTTDDGVVV